MSVTLLVVNVIVCWVLLHGKDGSMLFTCVGLSPKQ